MNITIAGAGNMGLCLLGYLTEKGNSVVLYTSSSKLNDKTLILENHETKQEKVIRGYEVTSSVGKAFLNCDVVLCTYPAFLRKKFIKLIEDVINPSSILCFVPGYGGAEYYCRNMLSRGVKICGFQRVPYVARYTVREDKILAKILSIKNRLYIAAIPKKSTQEIALLIENLLDIPTIPLKEYLAVTLSPSNPLLHLSGLYGFFGESPKETIYSKEHKFYEEWNDSTSQLLFDYDKELHSICDAMETKFNLYEVVPLSEYYESPTPKDLTRKLKSIEAFNVVKIPLKEVQTGEYVIDIDSRMFVEDFPFGVCIFKAFALMTDVKTPIIDNLLLFYQRVSGKKYFLGEKAFGPNIEEAGIPQLSGINSLNDLADFYS